MSAYSELQNELRASPKNWLVTGVAGFIGSNLLEALLRLGQHVTGLDNFATGRAGNLEHVKAAVGDAAWNRFDLVRGDVRALDACTSACKGVDFVLHQAALGSVPGSIDDPAGAHASNVTGFVNILLAARQAGVKRVVYASSSAVYGDDPHLPKTEEKIGNQLSPYAATKLVDEIYAGVWARVYGLEAIGLRYFNVFGPRQDPEGAYAAVIPKWIAALLKQEPIYINGDGETTRDFCFVSNIVQANLLAATSRNPQALNRVFNIALGKRTTLNELFSMLQTALRKLEPSLPLQKPLYRDFRPGDVRHSVADISKARELLGYAPSHQIDEGLALAMEWYRWKAQEAAPKD
jgi:UDP-N-acetylglucosamine 4-epimerase